MKKYQRWVVVIVCAVIVGNYSGATFVASSSESCGAYSLDKLSWLLGIRRDGINFERQIQQRTKGNIASFADLADIAKQVGLNLKGVKMTYEQLEALNVPIIAHLKHSFVPSSEINVSEHFVVVEKASTKWVRIFDNMPLNNRQSVRIVSKENFTKLWTGNVLIPAEPEELIFSSGLKLNPDIHDFGIYETHGVSANLPKLSITLRNGGHTPIQIIDVESGCTCAVVFSGIDEIEPGGEEKMEVEWRPAPGEGIASTTIQIETNEPNRPFAFFSLVVITENSVYAIPSRIYIEGKPPFKKAMSSSFEIQNLKQTPIRIQETESSSPYVKVDLIADTIINPGGKKVVQIRINIPTAGTFSEQIVVGYLDDRLKKKQLIIPIDGIIHDDVSVFPKRFFFGVVESGQPTSRTVTLTASKGIHILKADTNLGDIQIEPLEEGKSYRLCLKLTSPLEGRIHRGNVSVYTNHPSKKVINVPVFALAKSNAEEN